MVGGILTILVGLYAYLNKMGYIEKWKTKLSIEDEVAHVAKQQNGSALIKLSIPDELIAVFQDMATDPDGGIDTQRIIDILNNQNEIEKILGSDKPLTKEEKDQIRCIMVRAVKTYKKTKSPETALKTAKSGKSK
jgi:hypothetical protein